MDAYPDDITYKLVGAASEVLGIPASAVLEAFGEYWVLYTAQEGYGPMLDAGGKTLREFLENLDALHARVALTMPELRPPRFRLVPIDDTSMRLEYHSMRQGLAPMVIGLLRGLSVRFNTAIEVTHAPADGHDDFMIRHTQPS